MPSIKVLFASDMHYSADLTGEMALAGRLLPSDTYDHFEDGHLVWHNYMLVERMDRMFDGLDALIRRESPDLVVFTGDMVNTNWGPNVAAVAARISTLSCPTRVITGNHDIYLDGPGTRLQESVKPGEYATGFRHELIDSIGLLYLDLFVQYPDGKVAKTTEPDCTQAAAAYRAEDIDAALRELDQSTRSSIHCDWSFSDAASAGAVAGTRTKNWLGNGHQARRWDRGFSNPQIWWA